MTASTRPGPTRRGVARQALALALMGAGAIHLSLGPEHMAEWSVLGYGFFASGTVQILLGLGLLRTESRRALALAALASLTLIGVWAVSRTSGLPFGPQAGQAEGLGRADLICVALESVVALGALILLRRPSAGRAPAGRLAVRGLLAGVTMAVLATTGVAVAAPGHAHPGQTCPTSAVTTGVDKNGNGADDGIEAYFSCKLLHEHDDHKGYVSPKL